MHGVDGGQGKHRLTSGPLVDQQPVGPCTLERSANRETADELDPNRAADCSPQSLEDADSRELDTRSLAYLDRTLGHVECVGLRIEVGEQIVPAHAAQPMPGHDGAPTGNPGGAPL